MSEQKPDEFHGQGGAYVRGKDGVRRRVEEPTRDHEQGNRARDAQGRPADGPKDEAPAKAAGNVKPIRGAKPLDE